METNNNCGIPRGVMVIIGMLLVLFLALISIDRAYGLWQGFSNENPKNTLPVTAEGRIKAVPDLATVNLGVLSRADTASAAQNENSRKINQIVEFVKKQGITQDDIATSQYNMYPQQDYKEGRSSIVGYEVNQTITIKIHDVDQEGKQDLLGTLLSGVTDNGANQVQGVSLGFEDADDLRQQAKEQAITKAKEKAQELAKAAGLKLGRVITISESGYGGMPVPMYGEAARDAVAMPAMEKAVSPNIEPGQQDIVENMTLVFELK
jgi:uncharacterized protein